jgi:endonuclease/exonuclease/phosphatase family metal-dependent hydrolase
MARTHGKTRARVAVTLVAIGALATLLWCARRPDNPHPVTPRAPSLPPPVAAPAAATSRQDILTESPWDSRQACESLVATGRRLPRPAQSPRLATWNLRWFPYGRLPGRSVQPATDIAWVACILTWLDVDAVALQEIVLDTTGRAAIEDLVRRLDQATASAWIARFDDCEGSGRQHVGLLVNSKNVAISHEAPVASLNPARGACDQNLRPGYGAFLQWPGGPGLFFVSVHLDSGTSHRDFEHRQTSISRIPRAVEDLRSRVRDPDVVLAGDFNTMGCDSRGGCDPPVSAEQELTAIDALLRDNAGFRRVAPDLPCTEYYRGKGHALDHFLLSSSLASGHPHATARVQGSCASSRCAPEHESAAAATYLSDHCPVVLDLGRGVPAR